MFLNFDLSSISAQLFSIFDEAQRTISSFDWQLLFFWWRNIAIFITAILLFAIAYAVFLSQKVIKWRTVREVLDFVRLEEIPHEVRSKRWQEVLKKLESNNPSDWKVAVLDADSIMDDILKRVGYKGKNLGERLKKIEASDFDSLQDVWEAHKVRNRIAHESASFSIDKAEADRVIALYEKGLKELRFI